MRSPSRRRRGIALAALAALAGATGCATVAPWERETLAEPIMILDENPLDRGIEVHHLEYREGSVGGDGAQSGGCGCG